MNKLLTRDDVLRYFFDNGVVLTKITLNRLLRLNNVPVEVRLSQKTVYYRHDVIEAFFHRYTKA